MSYFDEIIEILTKDSGAIIPRPASEEEIAQCQQVFAKLEFEQLPQGYIDFLKIVNGLAWNGVEFYSTYQVTEENNPNGFKLMDLVTVNDDFNDRFEMDEKILLGRSDEEYYTYNTETEKYEILDSTSRESYEEFNTFEGLFFDAVGGRLGLDEYFKPMDCAQEIASDRM